MALERTLFIVKPDAVQRNLSGAILGHVESEGFRLTEARLAQLTREEAQTFYEEHREKPFFNDLVEYMTSGRVLLCCLEREDAVRRLRDVVGATDPAQAAAGTVRARFGESKQRNSVHASDSAASADREVRFFFGPAALVRQAQGAQA